MPIDRFYPYIAVCLICLALLAVAFCVLVAPFTGLGKNYSEGARAGTIQKLSKKGFIWKTYEGELFMGMSVGPDDVIAANVFRFSLPGDADAALVKQLEVATTAGTRVKLRYNQWLIGPVSQGSSSYIISGVERIQ